MYFFLLQSLCSSILRKCECDFNLYDTDIYKAISKKVSEHIRSKNIHPAGNRSSWKNIHPVDNLCDEPHKNNLKKYP